MKKMLVLAAVVMSVGMCFGVESAISLSAEPSSFLSIYDEKTHKQHGDTIHFIRMRESRVILPAGTYVIKVDKKDRTQIFFLLTKAAGAKPCRISLGQHQKSGCPGATIKLISKPEWL